MRNFRFAKASLVAFAALAGCGGDEDGPGPQGSAAPTYHADIAPLVSQACAGCHQEGGIGGFVLTDPASATAMAQAMAAATKARTMPPMPVNNDGSCNTYENARWLEDAQIDLFQRWAEAGAPLGDPADAPPKVSFEPPTLSGERRNFDLGINYTPKPAPDKPDDYHCFIVDPGIHEDMFVTGFDIQPGDARVVHHVALFGLADANAEAEAAALDAADPSPGYSCFGGAGTTSASTYGIWVPGTGATLFPQGTGIHYPANRRMVVQMHYNVPATGGPYSDRSAVALQVSKDATLTPAFFVGPSVDQLSLPPAQSLVEVSGEAPVSLMGAYYGVSNFEAMRVWGVMPHMHLIGRTQRTVAISQGKERCVTDVRRWDFHWQSLWWNETPLDIAADATLHITCGYDTRGRQGMTSSGEGTNDEMCLNVLYATFF